MNTDAWYLGIYIGSGHIFALAFCNWNNPEYKINKETLESLKNVGESFNSAAL